MPVVSTRVGWSPLVINDGANGLLYDDVDGLAQALRRLHAARADWFARRADLRATVADFTLESWLAQNLDLALRRTGVERVVELPLDENELAGLRASADVLRKTLARLNPPATT